MSDPLRRLLRLISSSGQCPPSPAEEDETGGLCEGFIRNASTSFELDGRKH
ncbi:hypothetical protein DsansV1_C27g0202701 [Dioscorea sansibarensis]